MKGAYVCIQHFQVTPCMQPTLPGRSKKGSRRCRSPSLEMLTIVRLVVEVPSKSEFTDFGAFL